MRFSKELRQKIIEDFARRNNLAEFDASRFLEDVRDAGSSHPAYDWFEWDQGKAALQHQLEQARAFGSGLRVVFKVEEIGRRGSITVREVAAPFIQSPIDNRRGGGGYHFFDQHNPDHMVELCRQAAGALRGVVDRYQAALMHVGFPINNFERAIGLLEKASSPQSEAAE